MTFSMSVVDKSARLALEAEDEENAMSSKVLLIYLKDYLIKRDSG